MKLLIDNNLSYKLCKPLETYFPSTTHIKAVLSFHADDLVIWAFAKENDYIILTKDNDFNELSLLKGCPPKIIQLICGNVSTSDILSILRISVEAIFKFSETDDCIIKIYK